MTEEERYQTVDLPFYRSEILPVLPPQILDFHTHTTKADQWKVTPTEKAKTSSQYMVTEQEYGIERLMDDGSRMFADREYNTVCFGSPSPLADLTMTNDYASLAGMHRGAYPLAVTGRGLVPPEQLEKNIREGGFLGYKVFLDWVGDDYGSMRVEDMIGPEEMRIANELKLVVLLHVPRSGRLADPVVQEGVRALSRDYPDASIVLAHCGRAYLPDEMKRAIDSVVDLPNVSMDTAMVMDETVVQMVFDRIGPGRVVFATDYPVAVMRGRRVCVMDHWVDVVLEGYHQSAYRIASNGIRATFMAYEIALAVKRAAELVGLSKEETDGVFYGNGIALLERVMDGRQIEFIRSRWKKAE